MANNWKNWCRLCGCDENIHQFDVFSSIIMETLSVSEVAWKFFSIIIDQVDNAPKKICTNCNGFLKSLLAFSISVSRVQEMFSELEFDEGNYQQIELESIREKYGVLKKFNKSSLENEILQRESTQIDDDEFNKSHIEINETDFDCKLDLKIEKVLSDIDDDVTAATEDFKPTEEEIAEAEISSPAPLVTVKKKRKYFRKKIEKNVASTTASISKIRRDKPKKEIQFYCEICNKGFSRKCDHSLHMRKTHSILNTGFKCSYCGKTQKTNILLQDHLNKHHLTPEEQKPFICPKCEIKCVTYHSYWTHMQTHKDIKDLKSEMCICDKCGKDFTSKKALRSHSISHLEERKFKCPTCPSSFKHSINLKLHMEIHGENYPCKICGVELATRANLRDHMICHTEEKNYHCNFCDKNFKRLKSLKTHLIIHLGIKPYSCKFCKIEFVHNMELRRHLKSVHPIEFAKIIENGENISSGKFPTLKEFLAFNEQAALMNTNNETNSVETN